MEFHEQDIHDSHAYPIVCSLTKGSETGVSGYSVFDYDTATDIRFTFDINSGRGLSELYYIINCPQTKVHGIEIRELLSQFCEKFGNLTSLDDWKLLDNAVSGMLPGDFVTPPCVNESPYFFQIAWKFQQVCCLRVSFIEGNHRHTKYSSLVFDMALQFKESVDEKNDECFFIRQANGDVNDEISRTIESPILLNYNIYVAAFPSIVDDEKVISLTKAKSRRSQKQVGASVGIEYTHLYVHFIFNAYAFCIYLTLPFFLLGLEVIYVITLRHIKIILMIKELNHLMFIVKFNIRNAI